MDTSNQINACVQHLNEITGLNLTLDAEQTTQFEYLGRQVLLRFVPEFSVCVVHAQLDTLAEPVLPQTLGDLLEANFMLSNTCGGALSWSQETRMVALNFFLSLGDTDSKGFVIRLNRILAVTDEWTQRIRDKNDQAVENAARRLAVLREGRTGESFDMLKQITAIRV